MPVGVTVYNTAANLNFINQQARRFLNLSDIPASPDGSGPTLDEDITRTSPYVAGSEQPYPRERMPVMRALQGEAATVDDMEIRRAEQGAQLEVWASPIFDKQGQLRYAIAAFQDITNRKKLEMELRQHRDQLEELVAKRTDQLSAFLDLTMLASEARTLSQVVDVAVDRIMESSRCQALVLHLLDDDYTTLNLLTQRGLTLAQLEQLQTMPLEAPLSDWLLQR
jgi:PAS domain-containing protein